MATTKQYAKNVRDAMRTIARKMGLYVDSSDKTLRVVASAVAVPIGVLAKVLVDKGVVTDAELQAALNAAAADDYPEEPNDPPPPES